MWQIGHSLDEVPLYKHINSNVCTYIPTWTDSRWVAEAKVLTWKCVVWLWVFFWGNPRQSCRHMESTVYLAGCSCWEQAHRSVLAKWLKARPRLTTNIPDDDNDDGVADVDGEVGWAKRGECHFPDGGACTTAITHGNSSWTGSRRLMSYG